MTDKQEKSFSSEIVDRDFKLDAIGNLVIYSKDPGVDIISANIVYEGELTED